ncbi:MAG: MCE family protein [Actinomycetota bacterium]|nr:MCE family protein [Actinomycetota bacterium]
MKRTAIKFGIFSAVSLVMLSILYNTMSNQVGGDHRDYSAVFTNVSGLRAGDDVRAAGVSIGRVQSVEVDARGRANVGFILAERQPIYRNTSMIVRYQNLLGQRYLALVPGTGDSVAQAAGTTIPESRTSPGFDLTALLNGFEPLFATLEPTEVNKLAGSIVAVMQGEGGTIESLLEQTASMSTNLASNDEVFGRVIDNLTPVLENLADHGKEFDTTVDELRALTSALAEQRTTIGDSIDGLSDLSAATEDLVTEARPDLARDLKTLTRLSKTVVENREQVAGVLDKLPLATGAFSRPMSHGTWLNIYMCNIAVGLGSTKVNLGGADGPYSPVCR